MVEDKGQAQASKRGTTQSLREHKRRTERNLVLGGFAVLFVVGGGVVWYLYGVPAMLASWLCLGSGVALFGLLYLILRLMEKWSNRGG